MINLNPTIEISTLYVNELNTPIKRQKWSEIIILSEVSQTEKDKYHMTSLICRI